MLGGRANFEANKSPHVATPSCTIRFRGSRHGLEQRIFDVLTAISINIDNTKIRKFAHQCAERRNEMSHFGAHRHGGDYTDFIRDLEKKSAALSILYHVLILHEIGVDEKIINWWIYKGFRSYPIKRAFVEVGLLDKSVLEPRDIASRPVAGGHS